MTEAHIGQGPGELTHVFIFTTIKSNQKLKNLACTLIESKFDPVDRLSLGSLNYTFQSMQFGICTYTLLY